MLRNYRWQLSAMLLAALIFVVALVLRLVQDDAAPADSLPTQQITPAAVEIQPVTPATTDPGIDSPTAAPVPGTSPANMPSAPQDDVTTYREALIGDVVRLNPLFASINPVDSDIIALIFEGMTTINEFGEVVPDLAQDWVVSFDGLEYVVTLRDDVLWHDGVPFTSADVAYTLSLLQSPDFPGDPELSRFWRTVEVQPINDTLIRFRLAQPIATFPEAMRIGILPQHAFAGTSAAELTSHPFNLDPIGTGPYQLEAIRTDGAQIREVDLRVAPNHRLREGADTGYALERIRFRIYDNIEAVTAALQSGDVDAYATRERRERALLSQQVPALVQHNTFAPAVGLLLFNWVNDEVPYFREERLRVALASGLDRELMVARNLAGTAVRADSPLLRLSWAYSYGEEIDAFWRYQPDEAAAEITQTLERLTRQSDDDEATITFSILTPDEPSLVALANETAIQWSTLGISVTVDAVPLDVYQQRLEASDFAVALVELSKTGNADPDVYAFWHEGQYPDGKNFAGVADRVISEALERARQDVNGINRVVHYDAFQQEFIRRAIAIPLYYPLFTYATTTQLDGLQMGFIGAPSDRFQTIQNWTLN